MLRCSLALTVFALVLIPAAASAQDVRVEVVTQGDPDQGAPEARILAVRQPNQATPPPPPSPATIVVREQPTPPPVIIEHVHHPVMVEPEPAPHERAFAWLDAALWFDAVDLGELDLQFEDPEVGTLDGRWLDAELSGLRRSLTGGVAVGSTLEMTDWLRLPQLRFYIGGGSIDAPWVPVEGALDQVQARAASVLVIRGELSAGLYHRFGPITPYVTGRVAYAGYFLDVEVQHGELGALGQETIADGAWELGVEAGLSLQLDDELRTTAAYRRTFTGAESHGFLLGLSLGFDE